MTRLLVGHRRHRIAVVDEQHVDRRIVVLGERAPEVVHVDETRVGLGRADPRALDVPRRGVAHRVAAAADAELAADRRQRQHRHRGVAAVAVALEPPAAADQRRRAASRRARRRARARSASMPATSAALLEGPLRGPLAQPVGAVRVCAAGTPRRRARWRRDTGGWRARRRRRCPAAPARWMSAARASGVVRGSMTTSLRAALLRLADVRDEVDAGRRRIDAPEHDQRGLGVVLIGDRRHLAVERHVGRAGRRRAHRARESRRAEPPPQRRVEVVLRQQAVRAAVRVRQDRFAAANGSWPRASARR